MLRRTPSDVSTESENSTTQVDREERAVQTSPTPVPTEKKVNATYKTISFFKGVGSNHNMPESKNKATLASPTPFQTKKARHEAFKNTDFYRDLDRDQDIIFNGRKEIYNDNLFRNRDIRRSIMKNFDKSIRQIVADQIDGAELDSETNSRKESYFDTWSMQSVESLITYGRSADSLLKYTERKNNSDIGVFLDTQKMCRALWVCEGVLNQLAEQINCPMSELNSFLNDNSQNDYDRDNENFYKRNYSIKSASKIIVHVYNFIKEATPRIKKSLASLPKDINDIRLHRDRSTVANIIKELYKITMTSREMFSIIQTLLIQHTPDYSDSNVWPHRTNLEEIVDINQLHEQLHTMLTKYLPYINYIMYALETHYKEANKYLLSFCDKIEEDMWRFNPYQEDCDEEGNYKGGPAEEREKIMKQELEYRDSEETPSARERRISRAMPPRFDFKAKPISFEKMKFNFSSITRQELKDNVNEFKGYLVAHANGKYVPQLDMRTKETDPPSHPPVIQSSGCIGKYFESKRAHRRPNFRAALRACKNRLLHSNKVGNQINSR